MAILGVELLSSSVVVSAVIFRTGKEQRKSLSYSFLFPYLFSDKKIPLKTAPEEGSLAVDVEGTGIKAWQIPFAALRIAPDRTRKTHCDGKPTAQRRP